MKREELQRIGGTSITVTGADTKGDLYFTAGNKVGAVRSLLRKGKHVGYVVLVGGRGAVDWYYKRVKCEYTKMKYPVYERAVTCKVLTGAVLTEALS